jgi:hypothetical protein
MNITEIRQKASDLRADTTHVKYAADGTTVKKAALFKDGVKLFAFPENYSPKLFPKWDTNESGIYRVAKAGEYERESWRHV